MVQISLSGLVNLLICSTRDKYSVLLVANMRGAFIDARPARQWRVVKIKKKTNIVVPSTGLYVTQFKKNRHIYIFKKLKRVFALIAFQK